MEWLPWLLHVVAIGLGVYALQRLARPDSRLLELNRRLEDLERHCQELSEKQRQIAHAGGDLRVSPGPPAVPQASLSPLSEIKLEVAKPAEVELAEALMQHAPEPLRERLARLRQRLEEQSDRELALRTLWPDFLELAWESGLASEADPLARRLGLRAVRPIRGEEFRSETHELLKVERTEDPSLREKIAGCVTPGISLGAEILRKAQVSVFK